MRRREFLCVLGGAAVWPIAARAQRALPVVGFLAPGVEIPEVVSAFRQGLSEFGYVEGRNIAIESRYAGTDFERLPTLSAELVSQRVNVVYAMGAASAAAAKATITAIPVVFYMGEDPVSIGIVQSFNRPGGNLTGVATLSSAVLAKRLELLRELSPRSDVLAVLINPKNPSAAIAAKEAKEAAGKIGKDIHLIHASNPDEIDQAFSKLAKLKANALLIAPDGLFIGRAAQMAELARRHGIPASHERRAFPDAGGLTSYGASQADAVRLAGAYVGRILKGGKPADMPVLQPTKFEMVINLNAAKALGLVVPQSLQVAADELIE